MLSSAPALSDTWSGVLLQGLLSAVVGGALGALVAVFTVQLTRRKDVEGALLTESRAAGPRVAALEPSQRAVARSASPPGLIALEC